MNIKVCGITTMRQLQQLDGLEVEFAGMVFYKHSQRYVGGKISKQELKGTDLDIKKVGVFMNEDFEEIMDIVEDYGLDVVQLQGDETPHLCELVSNEIETIKTFRIDDKTDKLIDNMLKDYDEVCDYYLFDTAEKNSIHSFGRKFDWKKIAGCKIEKPFFLSGGIGPEDASLVKKFRHPDYFGVNINSMFESEPGIKDMSLILKFVHGLK